MELEQQRCKLEAEQKAAAELEVAQMQIDADRRMWELEQQRRYALTSVFTTASAFATAELCVGGGGWVWMCVGVGGGARVGLF
jgi:hypothetical protein